MDAQTFLDNFGTIAEAPGGVDRLRELILDLAVRGQTRRRIPLTNGQPSGARKGQQIERGEREASGELPGPPVRVTGCA